MATIVKGNPFTHEESKRESKVNYMPQEACAWCGQKPKYLYKYNDTKHWFCNRGCWIEYNSWL